MPRSAAVKVTEVQPDPAALKRLSDHLGGEDESVGPRYLEDLKAKGLATEDVLVAPPNAKNVTPMEAAVKKAVRASKPKAAAAKATKPKAEKKPTERLPAETLLAELKRLGLTKSQAAKACGVSPSLVTEWSGGGRHNLLAKSRWTEVKGQLAAFAKALR